MELLIDLSDSELRQIEGNHEEDFVSGEYVKSGNCKG